ncbi:MAG: class I SAM-dependent methyltransferase [Vitreimonas sp.]
MFGLARGLRRAYDPVPPGQGDWDGMTFDKYATSGAYHWRECDRASRDYNPPLVARYDAVVRRVPTGARVLDVGSGDGYLTGRLSAICAEAIGIEPEAEGIALAKGMLADRANVTIIQGSCYELPFPARAFDAVVMADVVEHLEHPLRAVSEMARVLKADGVALISTPHWRPDRIWDARHKHEYTAGELHNLLGGDFASVSLHFCWPRFWSDLYRTPIGWRLLRTAGRMGFNPFADESHSPREHCQIIAVCSGPRSEAS